MSGIVVALAIFGLIWLAVPVGVALDARGSPASVIRWSLFALLTGPFGLTVYYTAANRTPPDARTSVDGMTASGFGPY